MVLRTHLAIAGLLLLFYAIVVVAAGPPGLPVEFWGEINATDNLTVGVQSGGRTFGNGTVQDGFFFVIVTSDNPLTYVSDPTCSSHSPCIPCSTNISSADYCLEGPQNGSTVRLTVGGNVTNTSFSFNENSGGQQIDVSLTFSVIIGLSSGFNLFSVPLQMNTISLADDPLETAPADCIEKLYRFNTSIGQYQVAVRDPDFGWASSQGVDNVAPGRGYWIKTTEACNLTVSGRQAGSLSIDLFEGFSLIGWYFHNEVLLSTDLIDTNETDCVERLYRYDASTGQYEVAVRDPDFGWGSSQGVTSVEPGRGYWVRTNKDCEWNHSP